MVKKCKNFFKTIYQFELYGEPCSFLDIDEARFYYLAWIDYLKSTENLDFLAYLQKYHDYQNHEYDE